MTTDNELTGKPQTITLRNSRGGGKISQLSRSVVALFASAVLQAPLFAVADSDVIGFWDFKDGTAGESAETVSASVGNWIGTAYKANASGNKGTLPTYSDACPSVKIFTDALHREVLVSNPKSLHFSLANDSLGGYVDIAGLSTELTAHTAFTVEFFARLDDDSANPWTEPLTFRTADRYVCVTFGQGDDAKNKMRCGCYNVENPKADPMSTDPRSQTLLNTWVHFAFVYEQTDAETHSGNLKWYVNRDEKGTLAYTNTPLGSVSHPVRLGTSFGSERVAKTAYNFRGDICALRVKSVALNENGFMSELAYAVPEGEMLGFWDFKDGAVGASATSVTNKGYLSGVGTGTGSALTDSGNDAGKVPVFSDDIPGRYVYPSSTRGKRLVEDPQSILFTTQAGSGTQSEPYNSVGGGMILFSSLGSAITEQESYTIECFFKDEDWSKWQWQSGLFGFYANMEDGTKTNIQAMVSSVKSDKKSWDLQLSAPVNATYIKGKTWNDGEWHHLAVVYDGSASPSTMSIYVDYAHGQTVSYENYYRANEPFALGTRSDKRATYAFRGKVCCLRIMPKALGIEDFMVASNKKPGLSIFVR